MRHRIFGDKTHATRWGRRAVGSDRLGHLGGRSTVLLVCLAILLTSPASASAQTAEDDRTMVRQVVMDAYVNGMHGNGSRDVIRAGFHPDFVMRVLNADGSMRDVTIEEWISRLPPEGRVPERPVRGEIPTVLLSGDVAVAEVQVFRSGTQVFTDYISLYRFPEGWRMVAKVFYSLPTT